MSGDAGEDASRPARAAETWRARFDFAWKNDRFNYGLTYLDVGERFNAEMGYIPRTDIRSLSRAGRLDAATEVARSAPVDLLRRRLYFENHRGRAGHPQPDRQLQPASDRMQRGSRRACRSDYDMLPYNWTIGPGRTIPTGGYTWETFKTSYSTNHEQAGVRRRVSPVRRVLQRHEALVQASTLNFLPLKRLLVETNYTHNTIILPGTPAYDTNTVNARVSYPFSANLFLKGFFQYNDERRLASFNVLFWFIYRPGSDLYVVFNQGWNTDLPGPETMRVRNRSLAIKMTYWLSR